MLAFLIWAFSGRNNYSALPEQLIASVALLATLLLVFPQVALAQSVEIYSTPRLALEIKHQIDNLESLQEPVYPRDIPGNKLFTLKNYLIQKNSPLADHVEMLLMQPNWKIVLAISHAESNMCKRQLGHNCWGIGGGNHRKYPSFNEAIADANAVLQRYFDLGHTGPASIMPYYVGWNNQSWIVATNNILAELEELEI